MHANKLSIVALLCLSPLAGQPGSRVDLGRLDPGARLEYVTLLLGPSPAQQAALDRLLAGQQDRSSPDYHRWLTPEQFGERFAPTAGEYAASVAWLESQGLRIERRARARNWIAFSGSAALIEKAFRTEIHRYAFRGQTHFANAAEPQYPPELRRLVTGVRGLDDFWNAPPRALPDFTTPAGANQLAPDDWATIYDVKPLYDMGIDGSGERVAIIGRSVLSQSYVDSFRKLFGLPPSTVEMHLVGIDPGVTNAAGEAALDVEWAGAIARNATIVYVYANNFNDAAQAAVDMNLAPVMSESLATCEPLASPGFRAIAQQANAQGITWVASSGDSGAEGCDPHGFFGSNAGLTPASGGPAVGIPGSFPEVTAVGGTQFDDAGGRYWSAANNSNGGSALSYIPEVVWNETGAGGILASAGGPSIYFPKPAWQTGPGVPDDNARDVPDISFAAAGNHDPYMVVNANGQRATGGTSAGAPAFAGVLALFNHLLVAKGLQAQPGLGNINADLYRLAAAAPQAFHDIVRGDNIVPCVSGGPGCTTGLLGVSAAPGYDLATGLGSLDVSQFANLLARSTRLSVDANPANIAFGDTVQLTARLSASTLGSDAALTGAVTFSVGRTVLGTAPVLIAPPGGIATLTVTGPKLPAGDATVLATYSGDANFSGATGSAGVHVNGAAPGSFVAVTISPNPAHQGEIVRVTLTELNGTGTNVTAWTINGVDDYPRFAPDFGTTLIPAYGSVSAAFSTAAGISIPNDRVYVFSGRDSDGRQWTRQYTLTLVAPAGTPELRLASAPDSVAQNPAADPSCQWSQRLLLQEQSDLPVQLTRLTAGTQDWTSRIPALFGTTHLAPFGSLQAAICWSAGEPPSASLAFRVDGVNQTGEPVTATTVVSFIGPVSSPATLSLSDSSVSLSSAAPSASIGLNLSGGGPSWSASIFPSTQVASWLTVQPLAGTGSQQIGIRGNAAGLAPGVYNAKVVFQALNAVPQFIALPVIFTVGANDSGIAIAGVANGASFQQTFAPGMVLSVFGTQLASSTDQAAGLPLPTTLGGASATINGIPAPLYYASSGQLNIQIPYETGAGSAVLGVKYGNQVASYLFSVQSAAPGIFADANRVLVPVSNARSGDVLVLFLTGEGDLAQSLATGASPFAATPLDALPRPLQRVSVTVGGVAATILFAGIPPGLAGVSQVNFVVPPGLSPGVQPVVVKIGATASTPANITLAPPI